MTRKVNPVLDRSNGPQRRYVRLEPLNADAHTRPLYEAWVVTGGRVAVPLPAARPPVGIAESFPTEPASPYGCSRLVADGYVRDYALTMACAPGVLRTSCVHGRRQNGTVGQGRVSWLVRSALLRTQVTVDGDGHQVRDPLSSAAR